MGKYRSSSVFAFSIPAGSKFIGTFMLDFDKTKVNQGNFVNVFATVFIRTRRYGGRTAQEGLVEPQILAAIDAPYECITSYDLYSIVREKENWSDEIKNHITTSVMKEVDGVKIINPEILQETALRVAIEALTTEFRKELQQEGIEVQEAK